MTISTHRNPLVALPQALLEFLSHEENLPKTAAQREGLWNQERRDPPSLESCGTYPGDQLKNDKTQIFKNEKTKRCTNIEE